MPKRPENEIEVTDRDFVMARVGAARACLQDAVNSLDEFMSLCVNPDEDKRGKTRKDMLATALEAVGTATSSLELAEANVGEMDMQETEPVEAEGDDEDEDEEDPEDDEDED